MRFLVLLFLAISPISLQAQSKVVMNSTDKTIGTISNIMLTRLPNGSNYDLAGLSDDDLYFFKSRANEAGDSIRYEYHRIYGNRLYDEEKEHGVDLGAEGDKMLNTRYFDLLKVHDVNDDGLLDLIVLLTEENEIHWCKNEEFTRFSQPIPLIESGFQMDDMREYHISGDYFIFQSEKAVGFVNLLDPSVAMIQESKDLDPYYLAGVADMNNDAITDFILYDKGEIFLLIGSEKDKVSKEAILPTGVKLYDPYYTCYADMNNDGLIDILNTYDNTIEIFFSNDDGSFSDSKRIVDEMIVQDNITDEMFDYELDWSINTFDYDGDGDQDVIAFGVYLMLITNNGDGTFGIKQLGARPFDPDDLVIEDMDYDGDLDLFYNSHEGLAIFENKNGEFSDIRTLEVCSYLDFYHWIDLDKDGDQDLLFKDMCDGFLYWSERTKEGLTKPVMYQVAIEDL